MKHLSFILMLLLVIGHASAQEESAGPELVGTDSKENTVVADSDSDAVATDGNAEAVGTNGLEEVDTSDAEEAATSNLVERVESTNRLAEADAELTGLRDPFWPVGYVPPPPEPEVNEEDLIAARIEEEVERKINWPTLRLKGITYAGKDRYMAIIAGIGLVESGQTVSIRQGDMLYSWSIEKVNAKGVDITRLEARPYRLPTSGVRTQ